jgi:hypothetical protein
MKNEIKRLAGEIELGNSPVINPYEQTMIEGPLAVGSQLGAPKLPRSADILPNIMIRYIYDGPFISIEVVDKNALQAQADADARTKAIKEEAQIKIAIFKDKISAKAKAAGVGISNELENNMSSIDDNNNYENMHKRKRDTLDKRTGLLGVARNKIKNMRGGSDSESDDGYNKEPVYRERAHSFQAPERALYSQMCSLVPAPTSPPTSMPQNPSFSHNQRPINEVVKLINEEIVARNKTRGASTTAITSPSAYKYDNLMQIQSLSNSNIIIDDADKKSIDSGESRISSDSSGSSNYHDQELHSPGAQSKQ